MEVYGQDPAAAAALRRRGRSTCTLWTWTARRTARSQLRRGVRHYRGHRHVVEVGGGIRDEARVRAYLEQGAGRVILGTAALRDFAFLQRMVDKYGEKNRRGRGREGRFVATDGWLNVSRTQGVDFAGGYMKRACET